MLHTNILKVFVISINYNREGLVMNRIDRISAILIHLQSKRIVKAEEIADRFGISKRTVYRDIKSLETAGIPIGAEAGKGYYIIEGYHLPPVVFTKNEAGALIIASKLVEKHTDNSQIAHYKSAMYKIKSVLRSSDKEFVTRIEAQVDVRHYSTNRIEEFPNNFIEDILLALADNQVLKIDYFSAYNEIITKNRIIEPVGLCHYSMNWHLIAFCRERKAYRDFRLDRIKALNFFGEKYQPNKQVTLNEYFNKLFETNELIKVTVRFKNEILKDIQQTRYYYGFIGERPTKNYCEMEFAVNSLEYFAKWLITLGCNIEIVAPDELVLIVKQKVKSLSDFFL